MDRGDSGAALLEVVYPSGYARTYTTWDELMPVTCCMSSLVLPVSRCGVKLPGTELSGAAVNGGIQSTAMAT